MAFIYNILGNHWSDIVTAIIAIYWAGLSTLVYMKNRWGLSIRLSYHHLTNYYFFYKKYDDKMYVSVVNIWDKIEQIQNMWFMLKDGKINLLTNIDSRVCGKIILLSRKLEPTEKFYFMLMNKEVINYFEKHNLIPKYFCVWDTSWKTYKVKLNYKKLLREDGKLINKI